MVESRARSHVQRETRGGGDRFTGEYLKLLAARLRVICVFGISVIPGLFLLDLVYWSWIEPTLPLAHFGFLRFTSAVYYGLLWVILGDARFGARTLALLEWVIFLPTALLVAHLCHYAGGIDSPYFVGIVYLFMTRAFIVPGSVLRAGAVMFGCWAILPIYLLVASLFYPELAAQLADTAHVASFLVNNTLLGFAFLLAVLGAGVVSRLQVQEFRLKRIGRYQILRKVGEGGMGIVYLARHGVLKRTCAIKLLGSRHTVTKVLRQRFEQEAKETSLLSHPNTIQIFDFGETADGHLFYAMEYIDGLDLRRLVERGGPVSPARAIHLVAQACRSIDHAHQRGIIHRDIKPENCLVQGLAGEPDFLKVLDFGLAKVLRGNDVPAGVSRSGAVLGTPQYMAPELALARPVDPRTDVYSLGCVLYYLLTGKPTFTSDSWLEVIRLHAEEPPEPISTIDPSVPGDLEAVAMRCLAKSPSARFQSAAELLDGLLACRSAGGWTAEDAKEWWTEHERRVQAVSAMPEPQGDGDSFTSGATIDFSATMSMDGDAIRFDSSLSI